MSVPPSPKFTYQDYFDLPDDGKRRQIIDGIFYEIPTPGTRHQELVGRLAAAIYSHVELHGGGEAFLSPLDVVLSDTDVVQPDVFFVGDDRAEIVTEPNIQGAPSLVIEVIAESHLDLGVKRGLYERFSVPEYWVVECPQSSGSRCTVFRTGATASLISSSPARP